MARRKSGDFLTLYGARRTWSVALPTATRTYRTGALTPRNIPVSSSRSRSASAASVSASFATASDTITSPPRHGPLRATTSYYPMAVDRALVEKSNRDRVSQLVQAFAYWAAV